MKLLSILFPSTFICTKLLVVFLIMMFLDYSGYGYYVFYLTFIYLCCHNIYKYIDLVFFLLLTWGVSYGFLNYMNTGNFNYATVLLPMVNCPILYLAGKYIARYNNSNGLLIVLYLFILSIAFISIFSVLKDVSVNGFFVVGLERNIPLIGINNVEGYISATGISSRLMLLSSFFVFVLLPYEWIRKTIFVCSALLAIYCAIRVQSRTTVVCLAGVFFMVMLWAWKTFSNKQKIIVFIGVSFIVYAVFYVLSKYSNELAIIDRFQMDEIETGGGRTYRLLNVASNMGSYPFGGMGAEIPYAHNLWFDCARISGIIPFVLLLIISIVYIRYLYFLVRERSLNPVLRCVFWVLSFAIMTVFLAEPVLEGTPMIFEFFCFLLGILHFLYKCVCKA